METMNRMSNMPPDSEAKDKVSLWLVTLSHKVCSVYSVKPRASLVQDAMICMCQSDTHVVALIGRIVQRDVHMVN